MVITDTRVIQRTTAGLKQALPYVIHQGGTSSGKTYGNCYAIISHLLYEKKKEKLTVSIVSINFPHLRKGAMRDFENIILDCGLSHLIEHNKSNHTFKFPNGSVVEFFSVDSYEKALGLRRDILFINECNSIAYDVFFQLSIRTRKTIILDYNPTSKFWFQEKLLPTLKPSDYIYTRTTYRDNKALSDVIRKRIESIQDDYLRQVYVEGRTGKIEGLIFTKYTIVDEFPQEAKQVGYGLDFGFSIDPTALVKCGVLDGCLYIEELIYQKGLLNRDLAKKMKEHGISQSTNIWCDNQPNTVFELKKVFFYNAKIVKKGADSILAGLDTMKQFKICIVKGSNGAIKEFENYKWETKRGESTGKPIDDYNHCFVGETLIDTDKGKVPIKDIKVGDLVLNSKGFNKVLTKFNNGKRQVNLYRITLSGGYEIFVKCTPNHKIKTLGKWIAICKLKKRMKIFINQFTVNQFSIKSIELVKSDICEVYDLMVENEHEYFANGLLVHNCIDAVRYFAKGNLMRNRSNKDRTGQTSFTL